MYLIIYIAYSYLTGKSLGYLVRCNNSFTGWGARTCHNICKFIKDKLLCYKCTIVHTDISLRTKRRKDKQYTENVALSNLLLIGVFFLYETKIVRSFHITPLTR